MKAENDTEKILNEIEKIRMNGKNRKTVDVADELTFAK